MIFGNYPCCGSALAISMPERAAYHRENCPACGAVVWHRLSRIDPQSWTEDRFLAEHEVDEQTKTIRVKPAAAG